MFWGEHLSQLQIKVTVLANHSGSFPGLGKTENNYYSSIDLSRDAGSGKMSEGNTEARNNKGLIFSLAPFKSCEF